MIFIKDIQNAKTIFEKIVSQIKNQSVNKTVFNAESDLPVATGEVITGEQQTLKDMEITVEGLTVKLSDIDGIFLMNISYDNETVNYHTDDEEVNDLLQQIEEEFKKRV